ncbi:hypothetical protein [Piscinibacter koreensis]|uniref:Uncharacterized protein n=1 Tax=Piscinibacter koreensis TaxID=2742824 RepID=A0A7Y6NT45_9BURK|nr:hypothetical protein [Schlegelella koreensis]NUZ08861.1 hypothetical protein [Schlegelella koreensis]
MTNDPEVPQAILERHASWSRISLRLSTLQYSVGIIGVACAALAAAVGGEPGRVLAAASGVCTAVLGFVRPEQRYLRFIAAWRALDVAILKFKLQQSDMSAWSLLSNRERRSWPSRWRQDAPSADETDNAARHDLTPPDAALEAGLRTRQPLHGSVADAAWDGEEPGSSHGHHRTTRNRGAKPNDSFPPVGRPVRARCPRASG